MEEIKEETPQKTEQEIIEQFQKEKKLYESSTQDERTELGEIYKNYMGKMDEVQSTPYDVKEPIPKLRTEIAYVKPFVFSGEPEIEVEGVGDEDKEISKILEKMVNYRISQSIPNAYGKIEQWVHQSVTFGTSVIKVIWDFRTQQTEEGMETPIADEPDIEVPNILDVYYNPIIAEIDNQPSLICRSVLTVQEVKENPAYNYTNSEGERNADKAEGKSKVNTNPYDSSSQLNSQSLSHQDGMLEVFERYTKDRITTICEGKEVLVLRDVENPYGYINAVKLIFEPNTIPNVFSGLGVGHNTLGLGKSYFKLWSQVLQNVKMCNNPMSIGAKGTRIKKDQLVSKPGGHVEVDTQGKSLNDVFQWLQFPDVKTGAIELLNKLEDEHKRASGANDLVQGSASNDTLGQDQIAQANVSNRFELIQRRFKHALAKVAEMILDMEIKNLQSPDAPILRIFPMELREQIFLLIKNEAGNVKFNIKVKGETIIARNKNLESKRMVDAFDLAQNFLTDREKRAFIRRIMELQGENNVDDLIMETNPVMEQQQAMQLAGIDPATGQPMGQDPTGMNQPGEEGQQVNA